MAREATVFYKRFVSLLAEKRNENYPVVMGWLRCTLSFSLLRSAIMCVRGTKRDNTRVDSGSDCVAEATAASRLVVSLLYWLCYYKFLKKNFTFSVIVLFVRCIISNMSRFVVRIVCIVIRNFVYCCHN